MPASKIQNEQEVIRWFEEGRTYEWMINEYRRKYNIETVPSMWGNFRRRRGLEPRIVRDEALVPWEVREEHRHAQPLIMLRTLARDRAGYPLAKGYRERLDSFLRYLEENDAVVHYDPDTPEGFHFVVRESGDTDVIRTPVQKRQRRAGTD